MLLSQHLGMEKSIIPGKFWDEISIFSRIVIPVSGGVDSTVLVEEFLRKELDFELIWNDTRRSLQTARDTLSKIFRLSGKQFNITYPLHDQKMITDKTKETLRRIWAGEIQYNKKTIPCCYYLKEAPYYNWIRRFTDPETLIVSGIAAYEGMQRNIRLGEIRNRNTFLRFKKKEKRWFAYPLRDYTKQSQGKFLSNYLNNTDYHGTVRSGCFTCPIVAIFENTIEEDQTRIDRSKKVYMASNEA